MYITMRRYEGVDIEALQQRTESRPNDAGVVGLVSAFPGFVSYYLVDLGGGTLMAISVYMDAAEAEVSTSTALEWVRDNMSTVIPNPPEVFGGYVLRHAAAES
ncbi:MAG: hypothetical protein ACKVVP_15985 [Chloroflexota bacterium]